MPPSVIAFLVTLKVFASGFAIFTFSFVVYVFPATVTFSGIVPSFTCESFFELSVSVDFRFPLFCASFKLKYFSYVFAFFVFAYDIV